MIPYSFKNRNAEIEKKSNFDFLNNKNKYFLNHRNKTATRNNILQIMYKFNTMLGITYEFVIGFMQS